MPVPQSWQRHIYRMKIGILAIAEDEPSGLQRGESSRTPRHFLEHDIVDQHPFNHLDLEPHMKGSLYGGSVWSACGELRGHSREPVYEGAVLGFHLPTK